MWPRYALKNMRQYFSAIYRQNYNLLFQPSIVKDQFELYCQQKEENEWKRLKNHPPIEIETRGKAKEKIESKKKKRKRKIQEVEKEDSVESNLPNRDRVYWSTEKSSVVSFISII